MTSEKPGGDIRRIAADLLELEPVRFTVSRTFCDPVSVLVPEGPILVTWSGSVA